MGALVGAEHCKLGTIAGDVQGHGSGFGFGQCVQVCVHFAAESRPLLRKRVTACIPVLDDTCMRMSDLLVNITVSDHLIRSLLESWNSKAHFRLLASRVQCHISRSGSSAATCPCVSFGSDRNDPSLGADELSRHETHKCTFETSNVLSTPNAGRAQIAELCALQ